MEIKSNEFLLEQEIGWQPAGEGVSRQIMGYDVNVMMVKVKFENGAIGYAHQHHHSQTTYVAAGKFEVTVGEQKTVLQAGDGFFVSPNKVHGVVCLEAGVLIDVFSPLREDFLK